MTEYAQGALILENPTDESIKRVLEMMTLRPCKAMRLTNLPAADITQLCSYETTVEMAVVFYGDSKTLEEESMCIPPEHVRRMVRGETVRYRIERYNNVVAQLNEEGAAITPDFKWPIQTGTLLTNPVL